jgi:hypothetical protein
MARISASETEVRITNDLTSALYRESQNQKERVLSMNIMYAIKFVALTAPLIVISGCGNSLSPQDEKDLILVSEACKALKASEKQAACIDSAVRLTGKKVPESAIPKPPPPPGKAREEITFKTIPFDQPGQVERLIGICPKDFLGEKYECPTVKDIDKSVNNYTDKLLHAYFYVPYGPIYPPHSFFNFTFSHDGSLQTVSSVPVSTDDMINLIDNLSEKYGPPSIETREIQNGFGAKFENKIATWTDVRGTQIVIESQVGKIGEGKFSIQSGSVVAKNAEERKLNNERIKSSL